MSAPEEDPQIAFDEEDERPYVKSYSKKPKFSVGQRVYLCMNGAYEGPYLVATVAPGKVSLCLGNGLPVLNGKEIDDSYVRLS
ncbi:uncharacterized protein CTHT_0013630 [Thermochaetoides thermophila DSM 1495]|uniref:Uncharacterized protein n=1 Tax=Chaetomium thermophilum (strain DSM 1495 / CBS 144.50 / IMI 039719) TaxID=759272 RepID=G0S1H6_CHATD|nr:hypothetical protein CTHT_0013630 [Thermochaetoides thermophila DSM 1495]EGS22886.1 hypothetical protein CTHT_0013630 [Thermochaetoides thermophila DSM 1495]